MTINLQEPRNSCMIWLIAFGTKPSTGFINPSIHHEPAMETYRLNEPLPSQIPFPGHTFSWTTQLVAERVAEV